MPCFTTHVATQPMQVRQRGQADGWGEVRGACASVSGLLGVVSKSPLHAGSESGGRWHANDWVHVSATTKGKTVVRAPSTLT